MLKTLETVLAADGASTKYCEKDVNMYIHVIFMFSIFNKFARISNLTFYLVIMGYLVKSDYNLFWIKAVT